MNKSLNKLNEIRGTYCLVLEVERDINLKIGSLGKINFREGKYCYVGSALNGLEQRVQRHLRTSNGKTKNLFWHIDYLLSSPEAKIEKVYYKESSKELECKIAKQVSKFGNGIEKFGCSDCNCNSHLFKIKKLNLNLSKIDL